MLSEEYARGGLSEIEKRRWESHTPSPARTPHPHERPGSSPAALLP